MEDECKVINYMDIYNRLKDEPAVWDKKLQIFGKLYEWKLNEQQNNPGIKRDARRVNGTM